jgi:hypothetical protein
LRSHALDELIKRFGGTAHCRIGRVHCDEVLLGDRHDVCETDDAG